MAQREEPGLRCEAALGGVARLGSFSQSQSTQVEECITAEKGNQGQLQQDRILVCKKKRVKMKRWGCSE